jgi:hypothetical protein
MKDRSAKCIVRLCAILLLSISGLTKADAQTERRFRVFIDCNGVACDENFLRSQLTSIDLYTIREEADVHVLITAQPVSGGGSVYQLLFFPNEGRRRQPDTLQMETGPVATEVEVREKLATCIKVGLAPFLVRAGRMDDVSVDFKSTQVPTGKTESHTDKWNYFVIQLNGEGSISADQNYRNRSGSINLSLERTTEKLRFHVGGYGSRYLYEYRVPEGENVTTYEVRNSHSAFTHYLVPSLTRHLSAGYSMQLVNNTFQNIRRQWSFKPVVEYNLFPYSEINNRALMVRYQVDYNDLSYYDTTIYNSTRDRLWGQEFSVAASFRQRWGNLSGGAYYRRYLRDPSMYSAGVKADMYVRIVGGLSLYLSATGNLIHDQVYIVKGDATEQEVLVKRRQLASGYDYYGSVGLNLRFGSRLNNFVNQRIGGYRGF